jgi:hypothetical protein
MSFMSTGDRVLRAGVKWIDLVLDRVQWAAVVNTAGNFLGSHFCGLFPGPDIAAVTCPGGCRICVRCCCRPCSGAVLHNLFSSARDEPIK